MAARVDAVQDGRHLMNADDTRTFPKLVDSADGFESLTESFRRSQREMERLYRVKFERTGDATV